MDKQEYKLRAEEIKSLIAKRDFFNAVKIADEIDWTRVRSVAMLCTVSDLYKANRRYKDSKNLLLMAYERHPNGRMILYSLCELCIKMGEVVQAIEYYKEFVQLAPMDNGKYVLQYKLYVAQEVSLEERIEVLEELKKRDYREKWGYELAYLYHRIGLATKCVEECDELILWFSDGRYVKKAMELKMLHQPLTVAQEASYNAFIGKNAELPKPEPVVEKPIEEQIKEPSVNIGQFDTMNLQKAIAESMREVLSPVVEDPVPEQSEDLGEVMEEIMTPVIQDTSDMKEVYFEDKTGEMAAPSLKISENLAEEIEKTKETELPNKIDEKEEPEETEAGDGIKENSESDKQVISVMAGAKVITEETKFSVEGDLIENSESKQVEISLSGVPYEVPMDATKELPSIKEIMGRPLTLPSENASVKSVTRYTEDGIPTSMANMLSQEYDGQIGLVIKESNKIERQITGQMNIEDVLQEWEKTKREYEQKSKEERTKRVLEQTGSMFTEFEKQVRDGILEQLEKEQELEEEKQISDFDEVTEEQETVVQEASETQEEIQIEVSGDSETVGKDSDNLTDTGTLEKLILEETVIKEEKNIDEHTPSKEVPIKEEPIKEVVRELSEEEKVLFAHIGRAHV